MLDSRKVAGNLRRLRKLHGLTQDEVAGKLFVTRQAVSSWEMGFNMPSIDSCIMLLELYEVTLDELLCLSEENSQSHLIDDVLSGKGPADPGEFMYRLSPKERNRFLERVKTGRTLYEVNSVLPYCSLKERELLLDEEREGEDDEL